MKTFKNYLNEGFNWATVNRHFPALQKKVGFDNLSGLAAKIQDSVPKAKYIPLMTKFFAEDGIHKMEDIGTTGKEVFAKYHHLKGRNALKGEETQLDKIDTFDKMREIVDNPAHAHLFKTRKAKQGEYTVHHEDDDVRIVQPHTPQASSDLARDKVSNKKAAWCTAVENAPETFHEYDMSGGIYMMHPKKPTHPGEMYQWSANKDDYQLKDENDEDVDAEHIRKRFPNAGFTIRKKSFSGESDKLAHPVLNDHAEKYKDQRVKEATAVDNPSPGQIAGLARFGDVAAQLHAVNKLPNLGHMSDVQVFTSDHYGTLDALGRTNDKPVQHAILDRVQNGTLPTSLLHDMAWHTKGETLKRLTEEPFYSKLKPQDQRIVTNRYKDVDAKHDNYYDDAMFTGDEVESPSGPGSIIGFHKCTEIRGTVNPEHDDPNTGASILHPNGKISTHPIKKLKVTKTYDGEYLIPDEVRDHMEGFEQKYPEFKFVPKPSKLNEDSPVTCASGGAIAGIGIGPKGEPGVYQQSERDRKRKIIIGMLERAIKERTK